VYTISSLFCCRYFKVGTLLREVSGQNSGNAAVDVSMAKAVYALRLEKGATIFAGFFLLVYSFVTVLLCTVVGGVYMTYGLEESFPDKCFGYPCFWVSWFDSVGNFANSGFTLNPAGYSVYANHPFLPLLMCFCMSSGIMFRTSYMTLCLSVIRRFSPSENLNIYCDHFFQQSVILRTLFDLNAPQLASFVYNLLITFSCTIFFFFAESHQRSFVTGSDTVFNQLVMFFFLAMSVRWSGTTVMDLSKFGAGSQLVMFCVLGLLEVPFDKCDDGTNTLKSAFRRFTLGANFLYIFVPLGWILMCQIGSSYSFNSFYCMFEVMSAFFNSGVTIPNQENADLASLSYIGSLPHASKIILLFVMLAGRFRKVSALPASCKEAIASWKASPSSVLDMRLLNQSSGQVVLAQIEGQIEPGIQDLLNLLETVPVIQSLSRSQQISLCRLVSLQNFSHGDSIIRQGDVGENAFIISSGSAEVKKVISPGGAEISLVTLQKGAFFGELALMNNAPRGASVYANGETSCIVISKSTFETIRDSVVSDSKARELGYALSEVDALRLKIDDLQQEISTLRRRKSITASGTLVSAPTKTEASLLQSASPTESVSLPGSAVDAPLPLTTHPLTPSRPVIKIRRALLSLPAPTPR
jgi:CRP-like cAMP-binding protein